MATSTLVADVGIVNVIGTEITDAAWATEANIIIPIIATARLFGAITDWSYVTGIIALIDLIQVDIIRSAYPVVTGTVPYNTLLPIELVAAAGYISPPHQVIPMLPWPILPGQPVTPVQVVPYGYGCPAWQFWG